MHDVMYMGTKFSQYSTLQLFEIIDRAGINHVTQERILFFANKNT